MSNTKNHGGSGESPKTATNVAIPVPGSATAYYSVKGMIMLSALITGIMFLASLGLGIWVRNIFRDQEVRRDYIVEQHQDMTRKIDAVKSVLEERASQLKQLQVTPSNVIDRANALARMAAIRPQLISDKIPRVETSVFKGVTSDSSPFRVVVRGSPEKIHLFFATLETEFPSIIVMSTSFSPGNGEAASLLEADTTYLVPAYAFSK